MRDSKITDIGLFKELIHGHLGLPSLLLISQPLFALRFLGFVYWVFFFSHFNKSAFICVKGQATTVFRLTFFTNEAPLHCGKMLFLTVLINENINQKVETQMTTILIDSDCDPCSLNSLVSHSVLTNSKLASFFIFSLLGVGGKCFKSSKLLKH